MSIIWLSFWWFCYKDFLLVSPPPSFFSYWNKSLLFSYKYSMKINCSVCCFASAPLSSKECPLCIACCFCWEVLNSDWCPVVRHFCIQDGSLCQFLLSALFLHFHWTAVLFALYFICHNRIVRKVVSCLSVIPLKWKKNSQFRIHINEWPKGFL